MASLFERYLPAITNSIEAISRNLAKLEQMNLQEKSMGFEYALSKARLETERAQRMSEMEFRNTEQKRAMEMDKFNRQMTLIRDKREDTAFQKQMAQADIQLEMLEMQKDKLPEQLRIQLDTAKQQLLNMKQAYGISSEQFDAWKEDRKRELDENRARKELTEEFVRLTVQAGQEKMENYKKSLYEKAYKKETGFLKRIGRHVRAGGYGDEREQIQFNIYNPDKPFITFSEPTTYEERIQALIDKDVQNAMLRENPNLPAIYLQQESHKDVMARLSTLLEKHKDANIGLPEAYQMIMNSPYFTKPEVPAATAEGIPLYYPEVGQTLGEDLPQRVISLKDIMNLQENEDYYRSLINAYPQKQYGKK